MQGQWVRAQVRRYVGCCASGHDPRNGPTCAGGATTGVAALSLRSVSASLLHRVLGLNFVDRVR